MADAKIGIGTLINNRYQIRDVLGRGGFGRTYLASDVERFDEPCVLKEFVPTHTKQYAVQKARELFEREARILYKINHPQIPRFLALFEHDESLFIVQEYISGKTYFRLLHDRLSHQHQPFSQAEVSQWLQSLLSVLDYLHRNDIVHRDISPDNIMLPDGQWQPILIDFGLVKQRVSQIWEMTSDRSSPPPETSFVGKFGYSPPEQIRMGQCYPCSDLYSLAVTAIVLLTGKEPGGLINRSLEWQWQSHVEVDDRLSTILDKMLAEKPDDRYQSASEVLALLQPQPSTFSGESLALTLEIEIDETDKNQQLAEIEETDYFKQLQAQADSLRNERYTDPDLDTSVDYAAALLDTDADRSTSSLFGQLQFSSQAEAFSDLDPAFLKQCQQTLSQYIGVVATCIVEDTLEDTPGLSQEQLIEALAAEIPDPQQSAEFKKSVATSLDTQFMPRLSLESAEPIGSQDFEPLPIDTAFEGALPHLDSTVLDLCQQALSRYIGMMAKCILEDTLDDHPGLSQEQLIEALAAEIPDLQQAAEFKKRVATSLAALSKSETPTQAMQSGRKMDNLPPQSTSHQSGSQTKAVSSSQPTPTFASQCQQELTRCIGPMAKYIVEDTLEQNPHLSVYQLIETLAAEIPNTKQAAEFRQRLLLSLNS
ncbi:serine/threonine protein kinase [Stenomitos frigidus]|uniref:serine/threonine protein kinase n=1 Tax=Stenomitos frigidus TaxID=1886765 RepID=UPI001C632C4E|nr:serine/threonine-protein kinase [Stenomitos frigidus]